MMYYNLDQQIARVDVVWWPPPEHGSLPKLLPVYHQTVFQNPRGALRCGCQFFEHEARNPLLVADHCLVGTGAGFDGASVESTWLGMNTIEYFFLALSWGIRLL